MHIRALQLPCAHTMNFIASHHPFEDPLPSCGPAHRSAELPRAVTAAQARIQAAGLMQDIAFFPYLQV